MINHKHIIFEILVSLFVSNFAVAQVSTGFFNGAIFNNYTNANVGALSGNNFSVSYSGTFAVQTVTTFTPGNLPLNTGYPATNPPLLELQANVVNNYAQYTFTNNLRQFSTLFVQDIDVAGAINESVRVEFFDAASTLINTTNIIVKRISTTGLPIITTAATSITIIGNGTSSTEPLVALTITSNNVRRVRITQLSSSGPGSYAVFFAILQADHGDAPAGYGDVLHFPSTTLRLGVLGPDAEATAQTSTQADGDNNPASATVINDEDAVGSFTPLVNTANSYSVNATVSNTTGSNATLRGWIDFNRNGIFEAGEASTPVAVANGATSATVNWTGISGSIVGQTYARFRIAAVSGEVANATGVAFTGEVEDYTLDITAITPLSFISFTATRNLNNITAVWITVAEFNVSHFVVEYSTDASNFMNAGSVIALNGADNKYQLVLNDLTQPVYYVRVKSVDIDGTTKYSSLAVVKNKDSYARTITVTPNPVVDNAVLRIASEAATTCEIKIVNMAGVIIFQRKAALTRGDNHLYINNLGRVARGVHIVQTTIGSEQTYQKIIIN